MFSHLVITFERINTYDNNFEISLLKNSLALIKHTKKIAYN